MTRAYAPSIERHKETFETPYSMFKSGLDTADIARMLWRTEGSILREINEERSAERGLPNPYGGRP